MFAVTPLAILIIALTTGGIAKVTKMHKQPPEQSPVTTETAAAEFSADHSTDQVVVSFKRELNHAAVPATPARNESIEDDVLYLSINAAHWTDEGPANQPKQYCDEELSDDNQPVKNQDELMYGESCISQLSIKDRIN